MTTKWYQLEPSQALDQLKSEAGQGLSAPEAAERQTHYGPNELMERGQRNPWRILYEQLSGTLIVILIIAALISAWLGDNKDALAILIIVVLNAALGFQQEYKAEKSMAALRRLAVPTVKVRREGRVREISSRELVPGDVVLLETGNLVPADGRLLLTSNLRVQEAALTGESEPVEKKAETTYEADPALADRRNMVYMGTTVTYGHGELLLTATGMATELGHIATMIQTVPQEQTPLQRRLDQLGRTLGGVALVIVAIIFGLGLLRGEEIKLMFLTAVSMAVAAVPEGLPAVVTIALALGAQRMLKRRALIRKLPAVETLGSVTVICSDKTGTLTKNQMTVTVLDVAGHQLNLAHQSADPALPELTDQPALKLLLAGGALCNDALLENNTAETSDYHTLGDPTETALVLAAAQMGLDKSALERAFPRLAEVPFDSERKRMTTVHDLPADEYAELVELLPRLEPAGPAALVFTKGALDSLLPISEQVWVEGSPEPLSATWRERIIAAHDQLAQQGMRILSVGFRLVPAEAIQADQIKAAEIEQNLIFVGLIGMIDPPRPEVKAAVETCRTAGIRPVMITGDHPLTARHVAGQLGIDTHRHLTGAELSQLSAAEFETVVDQVSLYARVSPAHKLNLIEGLQEQGHIVAMTGDGVNDAPALKKADIGVAMGITGTDVSKEAADAVLLDDNFATIVAAVEEGRVIYDNIRKFIKYTMTSNSGEIWVMLLAPFIGMPLPLLPLQILWINLVTDGLPGLAFAVEPAERDTMRRPPHHPQENIFGRGMARHIAWVGILMGLVSLVTGWWMWRDQSPAWQTMVFTTLTLSQMGHALAIRSQRDSLFTQGLFSNRA
ncbi:MAG: cation-translocating P-type ATPase, partial [Anaerolineae bacterium]|nr:cation-translocating P-type ATPase [Anaerolineae bacterium]